MSLLEKCLWTALTMAAAFICISLLTDGLQPHRFLFGVPFSLAILAVMSSVSMLSGGGLMRVFQGMVSELVAGVVWRGASAVMCIRFLLTGIIGSQRSAAAENAISVLLCSGAAFFLLIDLYQRSESWPKFDIPEIGRLPKPRHRSTARRGTQPARNWFGVVSCLVAASAIFQLANGLSACLAHCTLFDPFFISELGTGDQAELFTTTLMSFGIFMIPFFLNFIIGYDNQIPPEGLKFAGGGCMAVCGIIGIGLWDLRNPLHYFSIAVWLWPLAVILDQQVPTPRGFVDLRLPTWIFKGCMAAYVMSMITLPFGDGGRLLCIISQRLVVLATLIWLLWLLKVIAAESLGIGGRINGDAA